VDAIGAEYDGEPDVVRRDLDAFAEKLRQQRLVDAIRPR
jgi:hypothetical protein